MRTTLIRFSAASYLMAINATGTMAHGYKQKAIEIVHPWTFDKPEPGGRDAIVGMEIKNSAAKPDRLVSASSAIAQRVEIRNASAGPNNSSKAIEVGPGGKIDLGAKGAHLRLIRLKKALTAYDTLPVTLVFEGAGKIRIDVLVEEYIEPKN